MGIDWTSRTARLLRSDGKEATFPLPSAELPRTSMIRQTEWSFEHGAMYIETIPGDVIAFELPTPSALAPVRDRPVVYLDQNHWSHLAYAIYEPSRVPSGELDAARTLIELATERQIILPLSAGHMSETCRWKDRERRYRLAVTMLRLTSGWQMRDPLTVRDFELRQSLSVNCRSVCLIPPSVFTLEPGAIHGEVRRRSSDRLTDDLPEDAKFMLRAITHLSGDADTMLDADHVEMGTSPGWVDKLQRFTEWISTEPADPYRRRQRTHVLFIADLGKELATAAHAAGVAPEQMSDWTLRRSDDALSEMPALGLFREALHDKVLEPRTQWEDNDLTDLMYLTCAVGYADHVAAERGLVSKMEQGLRRLGRTASVHRRLRDLVAAL